MLDQIITNELFITLVEASVVAISGLASIWVTRLAKRLSEYADAKAKKELSAAKHEAFNSANAMITAATIRVVERIEQTVASKLRKDGLLSEDIGKSLLQSASGIIVEELGPQTMSEIRDTLNLDDTSLDSLLQSNIEQAVRALK